MAQKIIVFHGMPGWEALKKKKGSKISEHMSMIAKKGHAKRRKKKKVE